MNYGWNSKVDVDKRFSYLFLKQLPIWYNRCSNTNSLQFVYRLLFKFSVQFFNSNDETLFIVNRIKYLYLCRMFEIRGWNFNRDMMRNKISTYKSTPVYNFKSMLEVDLYYTKIFND